MTHVKEPNVKMLIGKVMIPNIGFKIKSMIEKTKPPRIKVVRPPEIFTPSNAWLKIKRAKALMAIFLINVFISI